MTREWKHSRQWSRLCAFSKLENDGAPKSMPSCCGEVGGSAERHFDAKRVVMLRPLGFKAWLNGDDKRKNLGEGARARLVRVSELRQLDATSTVYTFHGKLTVNTL
jgi:hypothetical protein